MTISPHRRWSEKVRKRDQYTCKKCGIHNPEGVTAHHIFGKKQYPELRYEVENGITLCRRCHRTYHTIFKPEKVNIFTLILFHPPLERFLYLQVGPLLVNLLMNGGLKE